ncbi:hypothetical protein WB66_18905, partial [bacteria symbiont BFo1 of Frankliniella occidentalis]
EQCRGFLSRGGVYYAFLLRSQLLFEKLFRRFRYFLNLLSRWPVSRCAVSVVAHYRDPDLIHNPFFDLFIWLLIYRSFR